jgi:fructose-bisphosphate aldolase, class I
MTQSLEAVAQAMVTPGKGILAADESSGTIKKRFDAIQVENTQANRRDYREMLFRSTEAMRNYISGVILYDETIRQQAKDGTPLARVIADTGALPGIKVDTGAKPLPFCPGETITEGLDGLRERIKDYVGLGAKFAKWRAVIDIGRNMPSYNCINANAQALARYAALCQENDIVPIVEPEVLMDGAHSIDRCAEVTERTLQSVFDQLFKQRILLEGMVLKPNMVISGKKAANQALPQAVAEATVRVLKRHVPPAVPGIAFLSGGQSPAEADLHLSLINQLGPLPWSITFSYGRALQDEALKAWGGTAANVAAAQKEFVRRAKLTALATTGRYASDMESRAA